MKKEKYVVTGMTCSACSSRVEKTVRNLDGMHEATVNLLTHSMHVEYDETKLNAAEIIKAVTDTGYGAELMDTQNRSADAARQKIRRLKRRGTKLRKCRNDLSGPLSFYFLCCFCP